MKEKFSNEESKLLFRTIITLSIIFFFITVADFFFSSERLLFFPTLIVLVYNIFMLFNMKSRHRQNLKFIDIILLITYFSFLAHVFFLDLFFVAVFCLLILYTIILFTGYRKFLLISLIVLGITFLLFLFREQNNSYRSLSDSNFYIGYLRATSVIALGVLICFIIDFWIKTQKTSPEHIQVSQTDTHSVAELSDLFESIEKKDNSFMPLFLSTHPAFINKIKNISPKINDSELEVCALIKLGLSTKEIAVATNSTYKAIESAKYRLRKKMNLESSINLMLFFNEI